jgi:hypothetical protein
MVERGAVNVDVAGSNPASAAKRLTAMWIIVKFNLASGQMRYFGPFKSRDAANAWGNDTWLRNEESWWGVTQLEEPQRS